MDTRRKTVRLSIQEIPEILKRPILLFHYEEVKSEIDNLSPLGIGLVVDKNSSISKGDIFYLKYYSFDSDIKCVCVFSDNEGESRMIGAYFTEPEDQKLIFKFLHGQSD